MKQNLKIWLQWLQLSRIPSAIASKCVWKENRFLSVNKCVYKLSETRISLCTRKQGVIFLPSFIHSFIFIPSFDSFSQSIVHSWEWTDGWWQWWWWWWWCHLASLCFKCPPFPPSCIHNSFSPSRQAVHSLLLNFLLFPVCLCAILHIIIMSLVSKFWQHIASSTSWAQIFQRC